jgi:FixJ family two-component response regulator/signal transduction histidine kinase
MGRLDRPAQRALSSDSRRRETSEPSSQIANLLAFERLLAELIAAFVDLPSEHVEGEIATAMRRLLDFLGFDRCGFAEISAADGSVTMLCSVAVDGVEPMSPGPFPEQLQWYVKTMRAGEMVVLRSLPDDLPPEAVAERAYVESTGMRSHLSIPLRVGGRLFGAIGFAAFRDARAWPIELVSRIKTIGEVLGAALARARVEAELHQVRSDLWHADRAASAAALTGSLAHELNQPLAAILSNAQAALRFLDRGESGQREIREILEAIVREDKRAGAVIRGLSALLRREKTQRANVDLADAVGEVLTLMRGELEAQGVRVETHLQENCVTWADKTQLQQIVVNLINNALDAMQPLPRAERRLHITISRDARGAVQEATVALRDSGIGMASEQLASVFTPFRSTKRDGMGLGLSIARAIVEAHDGKIHVSRNEQRGVTFAFSLPAQPGLPERPGIANLVASLQPHARATDPISGPNIWVVDDDAAQREGLARLLIAGGYTVETFASALEFLQRPRTPEAACMLLDVCMPGMTGPELQVRLRVIGLDVPIVFLTGLGDVSTGVEAMKLGANDYLLKPVDDKVLMDTVDRAAASHAFKQVLRRERQVLGLRSRRLSPRERDVMQCVLRGRLNKQIAAELGISEKTVKQHRGRVMEKMEARSLAELVRMCDALAAAAADGEAPIDWASVGDEGERGAGAVDKLAAQSPSNSARRGSVRSRPDTTS